MATLLERTLKRELSIGGRAYILAISPEGLKLTLKGRRKGLELQWEPLVSGDAALAVALNASIGKFTTAPAARKPPAQRAEPQRTSLPARSPKARADLGSPTSASHGHKSGALVAGRRGFPQMGPLMGPPGFWDRS